MHEKHSLFKRFFTNDRITIVLFFLFLMIATFLRLYKLDKDGLWYDEFHSIIPTSPDQSVRAVIEYSKSDQPPLFFILLLGWFKVFPYNEVSGKVMCVLLGLAGTAAMFFLGREVAGTRAGLASMFVTSLTNFHVYHSQELRFYTLVFFLTTMSFWIFIRFIKSETTSNLILFIVLSVALLYTHYFALVVVATQAIIFIAVSIIEKRTALYWLKGISAALISILFFLPFVPVIFSDLQRSTFWIPEVTFAFFPKTFTTYFQGWLPLSFKWVLSVVLFLLMIFFALKLFAPQRARSEKTIGVIVIGWIILTLLIPFIYSVVRIPMLIDRYTMITLPAVIIAIAVGWTWIGQRYLQLFIAILFVGCVMRVFNRYYKNPVKPQYREVAQWVVENNTNNLPVFSEHAWHLNYYAKKYGALSEFRPLNVPMVPTVDTLSGFYIIFQVHLSDADKMQIGNTFKLKKELNVFQADAAYYEK